MHLNIMSQGARTIAMRTWVAACYVLTLLVLMPLLPGMPTANTDSSLHYAMNMGVANHLRFGHDLVSTFGPLASAYTLQYSPGTDTLMLLASWMLATAIYLGFVLLAVPGRTALLLVVPVLLSQLATREALFMVLPLMLLLAAEKEVWAKWHHIALFFIAAACAILPLVAGTFALAVAVCTLLAVIALWERSPSDAVLLVLVELGAIVGAWLLCGQASFDLPAYLVAQVPIVLGYTEAMALPGSQEEVLAYLAAALVLVCGMALSAPFARWRVVLATMVVLFLCSKAGFVRHDANALIAAGALMLLGVLIAFQRLSAVSVAALAVSLVGWAYITDVYESMDPQARLARFTGALGKSAEGLQARVFHPESLADGFRVANEGIARREPLPRVPATMTADLYPSNVAVLLANGVRWSPRPIPQSYSAYTPSLAAMNRAHLQWNGPDRIFFGFDPIDKRYPAMDDGSSWPVLLSNYEPAGLAGSYAVLNRRTVRSRVETGTAFFEGTKTMGEAVTVPAGVPVWVQFDLAPTVLGRLADLVFKLPRLTLVVRYSDQSRRVYRFVPGTAQGGFLLSPTISTPADFVALQAPNAMDLLAAKAPVSFALRGARGTSMLWDRTYTLRMAPLHIEPGPTGVQATMGQQAAATVARTARP